jgi:hypothetical protein
VLGRLVGGRQRLVVDHVHRPAWVVPQPRGREEDERQRQPGQRDGRPRLVDPEPLGEECAQFVVAARLGQEGAQLVLVERRQPRPQPPQRRLPRDLRERRVLARRGQVQRQSHHRGLDGRARADGVLEGFAGEAVQPRRQRDVRRRRLLPLQRRQPRQRLGRAQARALQQPLPLEQRLRQLGTGQQHRRRP